MASELYPDYKESALGGGTHSFSDLPSDTIKCALVNTTTDYTYGAAHADIADVTTYSGTTNQTLSNKTVTAGVFDNTADLTFSSVAIDGTKDVEATVHYKDSGLTTTSPVICYHDQFTAVTPNGGDITVAYHASGIFAL